MVIESWKTSHHSLESLSPGINFGIIQVSHEFCGIFQMNSRENTVHTWEQVNEFIWSNAWFCIDANWFIAEKSNGRLVPNMDLLRKHLLREGPIEKEHLIEIIKELTAIMSKFN